MDIEAINPTLMRMLHPLGSVGDEAYDIKQYRYMTRNGDPGARLTYVTGDEFEKATWEGLRKIIFPGREWQNMTGLKVYERFNLVLSDAMHNEKALVEEMDKLVKYDLLELGTTPFAMFWDDCEGALAKACFTVLNNRLKKHVRSKTKDVDCIQGGNSTLLFNPRFVLAKYQNIIKKE